MSQICKLFLRILWAGNSGELLADDFAGKRSGCLDYRLCKGVSKHWPVDLVVYGSHEAEESARDVFGEVLWARGNGCGVLAKETVSQSKVGDADDAMVELSSFEYRAVLLCFFPVEASLPNGTQGIEDRERAGRGLSFHFWFRL